jgi:hypothetical protein
MRVRSVLRSFCVAVLLATAPGCFVFDEIDKASELSNGPAESAPATAKAGTTKPGVAKAGAAPGGGASPAAPSAKSWWQTARSLGSEESEAGISRCELSGRTEFMLRDDCLARGGSPK